MTHTHEIVFVCYYCAARQPMRSIDATMLPPDGWVRTPQGWGCDKHSYYLDRKDD